MKLELRDDEIPALEVACDESCGAGRVLGAVARGWARVTRTVFRRSYTFELGEAPARGRGTIEVHAHQTLVGRLGMPIVKLGWAIIMLVGEATS